MEKIVSVIVSTGCLDEINWEEFSCIFSFDIDGEIVTSTGYAYGLDGVWTAFSPAPWDIEGDVNAYEKFLRKEDDVSLKQMLFQFNRDTNRVHADFEYEDASRWQISPANLATIISEIKPNLG